MKTILACLMLTLLLTACSPQTRVPTSTEIQVEIGSSSFTPARWAVPAGAEVTIHLSNTSDTPHTWTILSSPATPPAQGGAQPNRYWQAEVPPGGTVTGSFTSPLAPGEYQVICVTPGHMEAGQIGWLVVVQP